MSHIDSVIDKQRHIYRFIWAHGPITKAMIHLEIKMKITSLNRIIEDLIQADMIEEIGTGESTGGRRPFLYGIKLNKYSVIGIDLSRTSTKIALMDLKSNIKAMREFTMDEHSTPEDMLKQLFYIIHEWNTSNPILGICIGSVGPLDREKGILLNPINFPSAGWENVFIVQRLSEMTNLKVCLETGANCAILAEYQYGTTERNRSIGYIHIGMGIRSGIFQNGHLVRSAGDRDDMLGHMTIDIDGNACHCGNFGCLECYCGIGAMLKSYIDKRKAITTSMHKNEVCYDSMSHEEFFDAATQNDAMALDVIKDAATIFGNGLANFSNLLGLDLVILSGPVLGYSNLFYKESVRIASKKVFMPTQFIQSTLNPYAIVKGCGIVAVHTFLIEKEGGL